VAVKKLYQGNPPGDGTRVYSCTLKNGESWEIYLRTGVCTSQWASMKIVAVHPVPRKANYWVAWGHWRGDFSRMRDAGVLSEDPERKLLLTYAAGVAGRFRRGELDLTPLRTPLRSDTPLRSVGGQASLPPYVVADPLKRKGSVLREVGIEPENFEDLL